MASEQRREASPSEELLLWWYFAKNLKAIRRKPKYFQRMLNQQRKIKAYLGWGYRQQTDDDRYKEVLTIFQGFAERFAFDADLDRPIPAEPDGEYGGPGDFDDAPPDYMR
jgi:hypothetical protein